MNREPLPLVLLNRAAPDAHGGRRPHATLAVRITLGADDQPPNEFRLFTKGLNETEKGTFLFDDAAAQAVMSHYAERGVDLMIDLEHLSLEDSQESRNFDPDARGWAKLEVRDGELWAVGVTWTPDGARRLAQKTQRYVSPAFIVESQEGGPARIVEIVNVAIVANPATHATPALVAANQKAPRAPARRQGDPMKIKLGLSPENIAAIAEAFGLDDSASVEDVLAAVGAWLKQMQDAMNGNGPPPADGGDAPTEDGVGDPAAMAAASMMNRFGKIAAIASRGRPTDGDLASLRKEIFRETGAKTAMQALSTVLDWKRSHIELEDGKAAIERDRKKLERTDRLALCARLVKSGAATPAMVWKKDADGLPDGKTPARVYELMSIDELKDHVEAAEKARGGAGPGPIGNPGNPATPAQSERHFTVTTLRGAKRTVELTESEVARVTASATKKKQDVREALTRFAVVKANIEERSNPQQKAG